MICGEFIYMWAEQLEMPVFEPNEYFWKHHWDGKDPETKWIVFADAVRAVMAECAGLELSDETLATKSEYKNVVWGKSAKND